MKLIIIFTLKEFQQQLNVNTLPQYEKVSKVMLLLIVFSY